MGNLNILIRSINKEYGDEVLGFAKKLKYTGVPRVTSGSLFLDWALGINEKDDTSGWPMGRIVELYGQESAGKSLVSLRTVAEAQKKKMRCLYFDTEGSYDKGFAKGLGVDNSNLVLSRESAGEKIINITCKLIKEKEVDIVIFDSLAAMIPTIEADEPLEQALMAPMARMMSRGLRKLAFMNRGTLIIFINQLREDPGKTYGSPIYTPGGRALKFYASIRVEVRRGDWVRQGKKKIGHIVKFRVAKNKSAVPMREGYFKFIHGKGIDKVDELVSLGLLNGKITRRGSYYDLDGKTYQGREGLEKALEDKKLFEKAKGVVFG
jgi:recombination protein RecA